MTRYSNRPGGLKIVPSTKKDPVLNTRHVVMPDGTELVARQRKREDGAKYWTAEVPIEIARDIYMEEGASTCQ